MNLTNADVLDSYKYYKVAKNQNEIQRSTDIGKFILDNLPNDIKDPIFDELKKI